MCKKHNPKDFSSVNDVTNFDYDRLNRRKFANQNPKNEIK